MTNAFKETKGVKKARRSVVRGADNGGGTKKNLTAARDRSQIVPLSRVYVRVGRSGIM